MFTGIQVENFLSLRSVTIELGKVNIFIGPNASGKSNIAKIFRLLAKHAREGVPVLEGYASPKDLSFNFDPSVNIYIGLEAPIGNRNCKYTLELFSGKYLERVFVGNEVLIFHDGEHNEAVIRGQHRMVYPPSNVYRYNYYDGGSVFKSVLFALPSDVEAEVRELASNLRRISVHSFAPDALRLKNSVTEQPFLKYHGENLARYLLYLYTERRRDFGRVEETLQSMIPEVEEIIPHIEGADVEIWLKLKGLEEPLKPHNISDGTLRILAIISALYGGFSLVVLEEPENCIHPYLLESLMQLARDSPSQIIMTTHSPYLLDHAKAEEVYLVRKEDLETKVEKLTSTSEMEQVKRFLEEGGSLGEAWYSGIIGGAL
jgi:energy-coupling factor transporter ATP-binding protein EcfA2